MATKKTKKTSDNRPITVLSYIGFLFLVPLLTARDDKFVQFHAKQGAALFLTFLLASVVNVVPVLGQLISSLGTIFCVVLAIMGIFNVLNGEQKELPLIGQLVKKFNL
jgi:uncharacterized membrane protein